MKTAELDQLIRNIMDKEFAETEYLCAAYLRETGLKPSEVELCRQTTSEGISKVWLRPRSNTLSHNPLNNVAREVLGYPCRHVAFTVSMCHAICTECKETLFILRS